MLRTAIQQAAERRQNLAQGEVSAASETLGHRDNADQAGVSGRQNFKTPAVFIAVAIFLPLLDGCSKPATNQGSMTSQSSERQVRSSADVVSLGGTGTAISGGNDGEALVLLNIEPGYHVNANP